MKEPVLRPFAEDEGGEIIRERIRDTYYVLEECVFPVKAMTPEAQPLPDRLQVFQNIAVGTRFLLKFPGSPNWDGLALMVEGHPKNGKLRRVVILYQSFHSGLLAHRGFQDGPNIPQEILAIGPLFATRRPLSQN